MQIELPPELFNEAFEEFLFEVDSSIEIPFGSAGSSKTVHCAFKDVLRMLGRPIRELNEYGEYEWYQQEPKNICAVRQVYSTLEDSYYADVVKAVEALGFTHEFRFKRSPRLRVECIPTGKVMLFRGLDDVEKIKGLSVPNGVIDHFTIEEATETSEFSINQLQFRSRGGGSRIELEDLQYMKEQIENAGSVEEINSKEKKFDIFKALGFDDKEDFVDSEKTMTLPFNPVDIEHWINHRFFRDKDGKQIFEIEDKVYHTPELYIMHSTHWDNQFLTYDDHVRYEQYKFIDQYYYDVYARGRWGVLGDLILPNFKLANMSDDFIASLNSKVGMDFGDVDPTTLVRIAMNKRKREIYIIDEYGKSDNTTDGMVMMASAFIQHPDEVIRCDSSQPITIKDLNTHGVKAIGAIKKAGYKLQFYRYLRSFTIYINAKKCPNFAREIRGLTWPVDKKTGKRIEEIPDGNDHYLDSGLMYGLNGELWSEMPNSIYGG